MNEKENEPKTKKAKKARKGRTGLPSIDLIDAISYAKKAYDKFGTNLKTFASMAEAMEMQKAYAKRAFGEISNYGLIEKVGVFWQISDLGKRAVTGDRSAVEYMVAKNEILEDLFNTFKGFSPERDVVEEHIKRKKPTVNAVIVADRFLKTVDYLNKLGAPPIQPVSEIKPEFFDFVRLKYALNPPKKEEVADLASMVALKFKKYDDHAIKELANKIKENKDNHERLTLLVELLESILSSKYEFSIPKKENPVEKEE